MPSEAVAVPCCGLHNRNCEPPFELCCQDCTEADHPRHPPGMPCILADPPIEQARRYVAIMRGEALPATGRAPYTGHTREEEER